MVDSASVRGGRLRLVVVQSCPVAMHIKENSITFPALQNIGFGRLFIEISTNENRIISQRVTPLLHTGKSFSMVLDHSVGLKEVQGALSSVTAMPSIVLHGDSKKAQSTLGHPNSRVQLRIRFNMSAKVKSFGACRVQPHMSR